MQCNVCGKKKSTDIVFRVVPYLTGFFKEIHNNVMYNYSDKYFCSIECAKEGMQKCPDCGRYRSTGNPRCICGTRPMPRRDRDMKGLLSYQYRPNKFMFVGDGDGKYPYFGVELEMERKRGHDIDWSENVRHIESIHKIENNPFFYCVHDGSLADGIEIISHPFTWQWMNDNMALFDQIWGMSQDFSIRNTCGMHVHINKRAFKRAHLYRFLRIFYDNPRFFTALTRTNDRYANINTRDPRRDSIMRTLKPHNKYEAVNTLNEATVEVRIFKGVVSKTGFLRNLNIVKSLYWYTKLIRKPGCISDYSEYVSMNTEYSSIKGEVEKILRLTQDDPTPESERPVMLSEVHRYMRTGSLPPDVDMTAFLEAVDQYRQSGVI